MRATIVNDGRRIGLILLDELVARSSKSPALDGFTNPLDGGLRPDQVALTPPSILDCTPQTLRHRRQRDLLLGRRPAPELRAARARSASSRRSRARRTTRSDARAALRADRRGGRRERRRVARRPFGERLERRPRRVGVRVVDDADDDVAPARIGEHVAGDADDVAQRAGLQVRAAGRRPSSGAACRRCRRPAASSSARASRARPRRLQQRGRAIGAVRRESRDRPEPLSITAPLAAVADAAAQPLAQRPRAPPPACRRRAGSRRA